MSEPERSVNPSRAVVPVGAEPTQIFKAFQEERGTRRKGWFLLALPLLIGLGFWVAASGEAGAVRVVTPHGIRVVNPGMTQQEVLGILGRPLFSQRGADGRSDCYQYGEFSLVDPTSTLYLVCYEGGRLRDVTTHRYSLWTADPSGEFFPPPQGVAPRRALTATP